MAEYIYSKVELGKLLHIINRKEDIKEKRQDLVPPDNFLQMATFKLNKGKTFKAHKHIMQANTFNERLSQESWLCISGSFKAILFDLDNTVLAEIVLEPGDCSITLYGGHTYECLKNDTMVLEMKTGPYESVEKDKEFI